MKKNILNDYSQNHKLDFKKIEENIEKLKVFTHPVRYAIMVLLVKNKKMTVTDIQNELSMQQSTISNHLKLLKGNDILLTKKNGTNIYYSVNDKMVKTLFECMRIEINDEQ